LTAVVDSGINNKECLEGKPSGREEMEEKKDRKTVELRDPEIVTFDAEELQLETALTSEPPS
jgi:hypothetical protein